MSNKTSFTLATCFVVFCSGAGIAAQNTGEPSGSTSKFHATHIMGFGDAAKNAVGELSVQGDVLRFEKSGSAGSQIDIPSIKDLSIANQDRQVGGTPLAVTRAAMPYGGGRVVGMFSHKQFDFVTIQYVDSNNALHGAIFQLDKGQGQILQSQLAAAEHK